MAEAINHPSTLIVAHAQHPLVEGLKPGADFRARLDRAADIYTHLGTGTKIYVPGSLHRGDAVSLAEAGERYLEEEHGISVADIHGADWNDEFRPEQGVYCSADEVDVAVKGLAEIGATRRRLIAVCSLGQVARLRLHYAGFGLEQNELAMEPVAQDNMHNGLVEGVLRAYTRFDMRWQLTPVPEIIRYSRRPRHSLVGNSVLPFVE